MRNSTRSVAEEQFAATQKKGAQAEPENAQSEIRTQIAKQKALRLAKEAQDTISAPPTTNE